MSPEELEIAKFRLEERRFRFDRALAMKQHSFLFRNSAIFISSVLSVATIAVSIASAVDSFQSTKRNFEAQSAETIRKANMETETTKRTFAEVDRKASLELLQYITANYNLIYSGASVKQIRIRNVMESAFPKAVVDRVFDKFASTAPTVDGPNVWQVDQRQNDITTLERGTTDKRVGGGGGSVPVPKSSKSLIDELTSDFRRSSAEAFANLQGEEALALVKLLTDSLLPQTDRRSYRFNLYAMVTLAKFEPGWLGTAEELRRVRALKNSGNYKDPTFRRWVDAAIEKHLTLPSSGPEVFGLH